MLLVLVGLAQAQPQDLPFRVDAPGPFGAGVVVGPTTGVSLAWRPSVWNAVQTAVGWDLSEGRVDVSADYLQSVKVFDPGKAVRVPVYIGGGAEVMTAAPGAFGDAAGVSARVPVGVSAFFQRVPIEVFAQVVPRMRLIPRIGIGADAAVGGRFYF
ncbi:MAG: hypothetical protein Q8P41_23060 [Pseudomonadota bacterium]|nr:hypothetical protein [Pseudomonadota bacterium]